MALGNQEKAQNRSDSPTADNEVLCLVLSFAASRRLKVKSGDLENAYFCGMKMSRKLLLRQPKGGLPGLDSDVRLLANVPIYGTRDAGRGFWKRLRLVLQGVGLKENRILKACYSFSKDGVIQCVMGTIVDDLIWAVADTAACMINEIEKELTFGRKGELTFRFCGREVTTNEEGTIRVTCRDTTMKIGEIDIDKNR